MDNGETVFNGEIFEMIYREIDHLFETTNEERTLSSIQEKIKELFKENPVMEKEFHRQTNNMINYILKENENGYEL